MHVGTESTTCCSGNWTKPFAPAVHGAATLQDFERWGVAFSTVTRPVDTSGATGRLVTAILAAVTEFERDLISERCAGMTRARAEGKNVGRPRRPSVESLRRWPETRDLVLSGVLSRAEGAKRLSVRREDFTAAIAAVQKGAGDLAPPVRPTQLPESSGSARISFGNEGTCWEDENVNGWLSFGAARPAVGGLAVGMTPGVSSSSYVPQRIRALVHPGFPGVTSVARPGAERARHQRALGPLHGTRDRRRLSRLNADPHTSSGALPPMPREGPLLVPDLSSGLLGLSSVTKNPRVAT